MKRLTEYQAIVVDLDGTLYYQRPVRLAMLSQMVLRIWRIRDFMVIRKYRKLYEQGYTEAERIKQLPATTPQTVREWMQERPLPFIANNKDSALIALLDRAKGAKITVIVYSDYPVREKLQAIQYAPNQAYSAEDLGCMKPNADGLVRTLKKQGISPGSCLVIGDRAEKDGALAINMGADALILPVSKRRRADIYSQIQI